MRKSLSILLASIFVFTGAAGSSTALAGISTPGQETIQVSRFNLYNDAGLSAYDSLFKVSGDSIESITGNGGYVAGKELDKANDNRLDTYWQSHDGKGEGVTNEVITTFKSLQTLNRIVYAAKQGGNYWDWDYALGYPTEFEIYTSPSDTGEFVLAGTGDGGEKNTSLMEFRFQETEVKRIKFVFKESETGRASASEFWFYKPDALPDKVSNIFADPLKTTLKPEYNNAAAIDELEGEVKLHPLQNRLMPDIELARNILTGVTSDPWNIFTLEQPGDIVQKARGDLAMSKYGTNLQPIGILARPGEELKVSVEAESDDKLPSIVFTQQLGDAYIWRQTVSLKRGMNSIAVPEIWSDSWPVKVPKGGAVYLENPYTAASQGKAPKVRVEGGGEISCL